MSFGESIKTVFTKYAEFTGRATRPEFWWWVLFTFLVSAALGAIQLPSITVDDSGQLALTTTTLSGLWALATLLPSLAVTVRRLRDAGYRWANVFWVLLPFAGLIVLIVLCAKPTQVAPTYAPPQGYGAPQSYTPQQGYAPPQGYVPQQGYAPPPAAAGQQPPAPSPGTTPPTAP
ncbi:DUF805 domain-containing protein [Microbacter sp. GSS18]|nr:DUF805 domain-containing protein [Microbacter sp. GSS18]